MFKALKIFWVLILLTFFYRHALYKESLLDFDSLQKITDESAQIKMIGGIIVKSNNLSTILSNNVILTKSLDTNQVNAYKAGKVINDKYMIIAILSKKEMIVEYEENGTYIRKAMLAQGLLSKVIKKNIPKVSEPEKPKIIGDFSEDGFERSFGEASGTIGMSQDYRDKLVTKDLSKILMQASTEAIIKDGQIIGFELDQIDESSIFEKAGLKNGDIVSSINNIKLNNATAAIKLLRSLKKVNEVSFEFIRDGQTYPVTIDVK